MAWDFEDFLKRMNAGGHELANPDTSYDENRMDMLPNEQMAGGGLAALAKAIAASAPDKAPIDIPEHKVQLGDKEVTFPRLQIDPTMMGSLNLVKEAPAILGSAKEASKAISTFGDVLKPAQRQAMQDVANATEIAKLNKSGPATRGEFQLGESRPLITPEKPQFRMGKSTPTEFTGTTKDAFLNSKGKSPLSNPTFDSMDNIGEVAPGLDFKSKIIGRDVAGMAGLGLAGAGAVSMLPEGSDSQTNIPVPATADNYPEFANPPTPEKSLFERVSSRLNAHPEMQAPEAAPAARSLASKQSEKVSAKGFTPAVKSVAPEQAPIEAPTEGYQLGTLENLEKAQNQARILRMLGGLSDAGDSFNQGALNALNLSTSKPITLGAGGGNNLRNEADKREKDHTARVENQKNDPKSQASAQMRDLVKKMGFPVSDNVSAQDLEKKFPGLSNIFTQREAQAARKEDREAQREFLREQHAYDRETRKELKAMENEKKKEEKESKATEKTNDYIATTAQRVQPIVKNYAKAKMAADTVRSMTGDNPAEEITALYSLVKGLDPDSAVREGEVGLAKSISSVMGRVEAAFGKLSNGQVLDKQTLDNLKKEIVRLEGDSKSSYDSRMGIYKNQLKARGIADDRMNEIDPYYQSSQKQDRVPGGQNSHPQDNEAVQWAKANPNDPRAQSILKANGM